MLTIWHRYRSCLYRFWSLLHIYRSLQHICVQMYHNVFLQVKKVMENNNKVDIGGERRMLILEKALEKSECDRAALHKQLILCRGTPEIFSKATNLSEPSLDKTCASRPPIGGLPFFNTRTDDIVSTALVALGLLAVAGLIRHLQQTVGLRGGVPGAVTIMCALLAMVFSVVVLFKIFLNLFGANSDDLVNQVQGCLPARIA